MSKVQVIAKARKPAGICLHCGQQVVPGDAYFKIEPYSGPARVVHQKCGPFRASERESNEDLSDFYRVQEDTLQQIEAWNPLGGDTVSDLDLILEDFSSQCQEIGERVQEKFDNMPEGLQQGDVGQTLEERASTLQDVNVDAQLEDFEEGEEKTEEETEDTKERDTRYSDWISDTRDAAVGAVEEVEVS